MSTSINLQDKRLSPARIADYIQSLEADQQQIVFNDLPGQKAVQTFEYLPFPSQKLILSGLSSEKTAYILNNLSPDDRTAFLEELPASIVNQIIKLLSPEERILTLKLLGYPEDSIGRLMTPEYIAIKKEWPVKKALDFIRLYGKDSETVSVIYIVDEQGKLLDDLKIREFLFAPLDVHVYHLMDGQFLALSAFDNEEQAIEVFRKYERVALPVIDRNGILLGIVTVDDILNVASEETTEDIQKMGGMEALEAPYMETPFANLMQKRAGWLVLLFLGEMLTASALGYFEQEISKAVVLALFLPLIISSGGNSGSQASMLIIRAMSLNEISIRDWFNVMRRELMSGLVLGTILGTIGFIRVVSWSLFTTIYGPHWFLVALTVYCSLIGVVLWGTLVGSMLPFILRRLGFDPAVSSAPFVATFVDVTGLMIYFTIAIVILEGTLL